SDVCSSDLTPYQVGHTPDPISQPVACIDAARIQKDELDAVAVDGDQLSVCISQQKRQIFHPIERRNSANVCPTEGLSASPSVQENADLRALSVQSFHDVRVRVGIRIVETIDDDDIAVRDQMLGHDSVKDSIVCNPYPKSMCLRHDQFLLERPSGRGGQVSAF